MSERLAHAVGLRGESDAVVRDFEALAMSACGRLEVITGRARVPVDVAQPSIKDLRADPWRSWALDYLERTCAGYDATAAMQGWRPELPDLALANREMGADLATTIALDDLRNSRSLTELLMALDHLNRFGDFPEGVSLQRDGVESPARVFEFAVEPIRCGAMGSCRGDSLETAMSCIDIGCPRGTTREQLLIAEMPAAEVAAGLALRQAILRYRAKPR